MNWWSILVWSAVAFLFLAWTVGLLGLGFTAGEDCRFGKSHKFYKDGPPRRYILGYEDGLILYGMHCYKCNKVVPDVIPEHFAMRLDEKSHSYMHKQSEPAPPVHVSVIEWEQEEYDV